MWALRAWRGKIKSILTFKARAREEASELARELQLLPTSKNGSALGDDAGETAGGESAGESALELEAGAHAIRDAELLLASLRMLLLLALAVTPLLRPIREAYEPGALTLMAVAGVYNIFAIVASIYPARFRLRRAIIIAMDATLISAWIHISGRWDLLPFYYVVVVVAAMWYRVLGGVIMAAVCNFMWLLLWLLPLARMDIRPRQWFEVFSTLSVPLNAVLFFVIGALAGYIAEAQDREREQSLERELLIANYQSEIDLSGELQPLLLSRLEKGGHAQDLDIGAALQSARGVGGGDYLDAIPLPNGTTLLCIADVSGKSIRAQARVPLLKYSLRALAPLHAQPAELMGRLQTTLLPDLGPELYIAICLIVVDADAQSLTWCNAGHLAPLLVRGDHATTAGRVERFKNRAAANQNINQNPDQNLGQNASQSAAPDVAAASQSCVVPIELAATAPALGLFPDVKIAQKTTDWKPGDALLMFTDGLPDALSYGGEIDGEAQVRTLAGVLQHNPIAGAPPPSPAEAARELVGLAGVALGEAPFVARHFTLARDMAAKTVHRDDVAVLIARNIRRDGAH